MSTTGAGRASGRLLATAGATFLVAFAAFPHRLEYPAHVLAGMGLAGLGVAAVALAGRAVGSLEVASVLIGVVVVAVFADRFVMGPFEVLDVANTTMGGLLGLAAVVPVLAPVLAPGRIPTDDPHEFAVSPERDERGRLVVAGAVLVGVGLLLRYPVQATVKHWWWFG